jgi:glycosyltransferase 2 family protein
MLWLRLLITLASLGYLYTQINWPSFFEIAKHLSWPGIGLFVIVYWLIQSVCVKKWQTIVSALEGNLSFLEGLSIYLAGMFANLFLPSSIGGDVLRSVKLSAQSGLSPVKSAMSIFYERLSGVVAMVMLSTLGLIMLPSSLPYYESVLGGILSVLLVGGSILFFLPTLVAILPQVLRARLVAEEWPGYRTAFASVAYSLFSQSLMVMLLWSILFQFHTLVNFFTVAAIFGVATLASLIPSINGLGPREASYVFLFTHWTFVSADLASLLSMVLLTVTMIASLPGCFWVFKKNKQKIA